MSNEMKPLSEADYEAIEAAVLETSRGRWFLAEYAKRNRNADTTVLLDAIGKLERSIDAQSTAAAAGSAEQIRFDIVEMAAAIAQTKREIASIKPEGEDQGHVSVATEELDAIVGAAELATQSILEAAESVQELAWGMREDSMREDLCENLDKLVTEIYTACSFQDLTGQRIRKVVSVLRYLEERLESMRQIWGDEDTAALQPPVLEEERSDAHLLNGPQLAGQGLDQDDIDQVIDDEAASEDDAEPVALELVNGEHHDAPEAPINGTHELEVSDVAGDLSEIVFTDEDGDDDGALALEAAEEIVTLSVEDEADPEPSTASEMGAMTALPAPCDLEDDFLPERFDGEEDTPDEDDDGHIILVRKPLDEERAEQSQWREAEDPLEQTDPGEDIAPISADDLSEKDKAALFS